MIIFTNNDPKNLAKSKVVKQKVRQAKNGKLSPEEIQHLKRRGININPQPKSLNTRLIRKITNWWETTPIEKFLEDVDDLLRKSAFLSIIALLAQITIITSLIGWWIGRAETRENDIFSTWQVVNDADEDQSGVVKIALERLLRNKFSLAGLNLEKTNLGYANLQEADLWSANLQEADLGYANLQEAVLWSANLQEADLVYAKLQKADLGYANLQEADLRYANLQEADLEFANLQEADLDSANLQEADLGYANLQEADLGYANLQEADLRSANLQEADLRSANLQQAYLGEAENLTHKQIKSACFWETAIYKGEYNFEKEAYVAIEPDNTEFIEKLKNDSSSDPEEPIHCTYWEKKSN